MNQTTTLTRSFEEICATQTKAQFLVFESQPFDSFITEKLEENGKSVLKVESLTELVFHSRSFKPMAAFIGIDTVRLEHIDVRIIRQKLAATYLYLLVDEEVDVQEIQKYFGLGFDDFWYRSKSSLSLLPLAMEKSKQRFLQPIKSQPKEQPSCERDENFRFVECLSTQLTPPIEQLLQFSHIALQRNHRQQFTQVAHYLAEMKLIAGELKDYLQDLKELLQLQLRGTPFKLEEIDLTELIRKIKRQFLPIAESHRIHLEFFNHTEHPYAKGDFAKLSRVLSLLLKDLLKALKENETLSVELSQVDTDFEITLQASSLIFLDQLCSPLFELFEQKKNKIQSKRADFGLALCKELMKRQQGDLLLTHERSRKMTKFVLKIPCLNSLFAD